MKKQFNLRDTWRQRLLGEKPYGTITSIDLKLWSDPKWKLLAIVSENDVR